MISRLASSKQDLLGIAYDYAERPATSPAEHARAQELRASTGLRVRA